MARARSGLWMIAVVGVSLVAAECAVAQRASGQAPVATFRGDAAHAGVYAAPTPAAYAGLAWRVQTGGTVVSSAYQLALDVIKQRYRPSDWNIYPFHFSDGDNYYSDNEEAVKLADELITTCNLFGYGEIGEEGSSSYRRSSGALLSIFNDRLQNKDHFVGVRIDDKEDVYPALKQFFGKRGVETPA